MSQEKPARVRRPSCQVKSWLPRAIPIGVDLAHVHEIEMVEAKDRVRLHAGRIVFLRVNKGISALAAGELVGSPAAG